MQKPLKQIAFRIGILAGIIALFSLIGPIAILEIEDWYRDWKATNSQVAMLGPDNPPSPENFAPDYAVPEQPAITDFQILSADKISHEIRGDELVLGVVLDGEARAYSINMMTGPQREIFNDVLAGRPIAATW